MSTNICDRCGELAYKGLDVEIEGYPTQVLCNRCYMFESGFICHCGKDVTYGYDGNPEHSRGMCEDCDAVRCDAYPGTCA